MKVTELEEAIRKALADGKPRSSREVTAALDGRWGFVDVIRRLGQMARDGEVQQLGRPGTRSGVTWRLKPQEVTL